MTEIKMITFFLCVIGKKRKIHFHQGKINKHGSLCTDVNDQYIFGLDTFEKRQKKWTTTTTTILTQFAKKVKFR